MKYLRVACEQEMIAEFLKGEINSTRYKDEIASICMAEGVTEKTIISPDIKDGKENELRNKVMKAFRGYPDSDMFESFPIIEGWDFCECEKADIDSIYYINYCYWNELSKNTGLPRGAAETVKRDVRIYDVSNDNYKNGAEYIKNNTFPPVILITCDYKKFLLIEGHCRMTVYGMEPEYFAGSKAYVGRCSREELLKYDKRNIFAD